MRQRRIIISALCAAGVLVHALPAAGTPVQVTVPTPVAAVAPATTVAPVPTVAPTPTPTPTPTPVASTATSPATVVEPNAVVMDAIGVDEVAADGRGIDVAVIDTGVIPVAGVPAANVIYGPDTTSDAFNAKLRNLDTVGHGTNMASLVLDVAPAARIVSVKIGSANASPSVATIVAAIDWTILNAKRDGRNIRVINISFGLPKGSDFGLVAGALKRAWSAGIVVVTAAGNQGNTASSLDAPANDPKFLAVGAASVAPLTVAPFSSGANGPGARVPDLVTPGVSLVGARVPGSLLDMMFPEARVGEFGFRGSGTSQAAAVTSGAAALLLQQRPNLTPDQVKAMLTTTAQPLAGTPRTVQGKGLARVDKAATAVPPTMWTSTWLNFSFLTQLLYVPLKVLLAPVELLLGGFTLGGTDWSGNRWSGNRWSGNRWSGSSWSGSSWQ